MSNGTPLRPVSLWADECQNFITEFDPLEPVDADLFHTLQDLKHGTSRWLLRPDCSSTCAAPQGKLIASLMAALAEFERDLLRERVRSGIVAAQKRGVVFGQRPSQRVNRIGMSPKS